jgi:hypothetical protein
MAHNIRRIAKEQIGASSLIKLFRRLSVIPPEGTPEGDTFEHPSQLVGAVIPKEVVDTTEVKDVEDILIELRNVYSASGMRSLRYNMGEQKHPVLNLIRQIAKANGLLLEPRFQSNGYDADGRKRVKRWFVVKSMDISTEIRGDAECSGEPENTRQISHLTPLEPLENLRIVDAASVPTLAPVTVSVPEPKTDPESASTKLVSGSVTIEFPQQAQETTMRRRRKVFPKLERMPPESPSQN